MSGVAVTGGTGFIGRALVASLLADGRRVTVLTRSRAGGAPAGTAPRTGDLPRGADAVVWPAGTDAPGRTDSQEGGPWWEALEGVEAVVHLAGESIAAGRWTPARKQRILASRVEGTRMLVDALERLERRPRVLVSGSAVGYYGPRGDEEVTEAEGPGRDFLSQVCVAWEEQARRAERLGVRVVLLRTGLVLGPDGGALPRLLLPFRLFLGGPLGSGRQWMPWVHRDDVVGLIRTAIERDAFRGPINVVAPEPVTNRAFCRVVARVLRRPCWLPAPAPLLRLALGELAEPLLLGGQRAVPARAIELGYPFRYPALEPALRAILGAGIRRGRAMPG